MVSGTYIREHLDELQDTKILHIMDMCDFDKDFLREIFGTKSEEEIRNWQCQILAHSALADAKMNEGNHKFVVVPFDTINLLTNEITYIKYCKLYYNKLRDKLKILETYLQWKKAHTCINYYTEPVQYTDGMGRVLDTVIINERWEEVEC